MLAVMLWVPRWKALVGWTGAGAASGLHPGCKVMSARNRKVRLELAHGKLGDLCVALL